MKINSDKKVKFPNFLGSVLEMYPPLVTLESPRPASTVNAKINEPLSEPETELIIYKVQSGDTLWDIANKYNVSTGDLKKWNKQNVDNLVNFIKKLKNSICYQFLKDIQETNNKLFTQMLERQEIIDRI